VLQASKQNALYLQCVSFLYKDNLNRRLSGNLRRFAAYSIVNNIIIVLGLIAGFSNAKSHIGVLHQSFVNDIARLSEAHFRLSEACNRLSEACNRESEACNRESEARIRALYFLLTPYFTGLSEKIFKTNKNSN
jgi:hypothetical protein